MAPDGTVASMGTGVVLLAKQAVRPFDSTRSDRGADLRSLGVVMVAGGAALSVAPDVGVLCPIRRLTGVPCPFCGMTTGTLALGDGDVVGSVAANPLAIVLVTAVVVAFIPGIYRAGWFRSAWRRLKPVAPLLSLTVLSLLWLWELDRFGFI